MGGGGGEGGGGGIKTINLSYAEFAHRVVKVKEWQFCVFVHQLY